MLFSPPPSPPFQIATSPQVFEAEDSHPSSPHPFPAMQIGWFDVGGLFAAAPNLRLDLAMNAVLDTQSVTDAQVLMLINYGGMQPLSRL